MMASSSAARRLHRLFCFACTCVFTVAGTLDLRIARSVLVRSAAGLGATAAGVRLGVPLLVGRPRLPPPRSGAPFAHVGVREVRLPPTGCRARVLYPCAAPPAGAVEAPYLTDGADGARAIAALYGLRRLRAGFALNQLARAGSGCFADAPVHESASCLPVLAYSHGFGGTMDISIGLLRLVACEGCVVVAVEHTDGTACRTLAADGSEVPFAPRVLSRPAQLKRRADELLAALAPDALPADIAATVDAGASFLGGHSYGGAAALTAATAGGRAAARLRGLILHDPAVSNATAALPAGALPVLSFTSDEFDRSGVRAGTTLHAVGARHGNFVDSPLWARLWVMRAISGVIGVAGPVPPVPLHRALARSAHRFMRAPQAGWRGLGLNVLADASAQQPPPAAAAGPQLAQTTRQASLNPAVLPVAGAVDGPASMGDDDEDAVVSRVTFELRTASSS